MYDKGECKLSLPSGCDEYGTKCVDHDSGSCSCEEYQKTCKPLAAIDEYEDITDIVDILE
jgi:hypothetical protein